MSDFNTIDSSLLETVSGGASTTTQVGVGVQTPGGGGNANISQTTQMGEYNQCLRDRASEMQWNTPNAERAQIQQQLCAPLLSQPAAPAAQ